MVTNILGHPSLNASVLEEAIQCRQRSICRDIAAERSCLAAIIAQPSLMPAAYLRLVESDFTDERHAAIWRSLCRLFQTGTPIDLTLLIGDLEETGNYGRGCGAEVNDTVLADLWRSRPSPEHFPFYLNWLKRVGNERRSNDPQLAEIGDGDESH